VRAIRITTTAPPTPTAAMHGVHLRECVAAQVRAGQLAQGERGVVHADGKSEEGGEHGLHGATPAPHSRHAQCCHDVDLLRYMMGRPVERVSSFGKLTHFTHVRVMEGGRWELIADAASLPPPPPSPPLPQARRPAEAADRCLDCPIESKCAYSAVQQYLRPAQRGNFGGFTSALLDKGQCPLSVADACDWGGGGCVVPCVFARCCVWVCSASAIWRCVMAFVRMSGCVVRGPAMLRLSMMRMYVWLWRCNDAPGAPCACQGVG
jgi:hypothetical protein